jgi:thiamine-phosphate pyrophosphorylase
MTVPSRFGLYAILTNPVKGYEYTAQLLVDLQIAFIQVRMKQEPRDTVLAVAEKIRAITAGSGSLLIINEYPDIAAKVNADGVHLGQEDLSYEQARSIVRPEALIGISTHSPDQVTAACPLDPAYIGIGPVFPTPTKAKPDPVIGIDGMKQMIALATVPHVAIGGITLGNLHEVLAAGARNFCMVREIMQAKEPERVIKQAMRMYSAFC